MTILAAVHAFSSIKASDTRSQTKPCQTYKSIPRLQAVSVLVCSRVAQLVSPPKQLARQLSRDPTAVLRDLNGLAAEGVVEQDENGKWLCPFSEIRTDFALIRAA